MESKNWLSKSKTTISDTYEFTTSPHDVTGVQKEIETLKVYSTLAIWPPGVGPFISIFLWLLFMAGLVGRETEGSPYFNFLMKVSTSFLSPKFTIIALAALFISHLLEACYVAYLLRPLKLGNMGVASYMLLTLLLGYPLTSKVVFLNKYACGDKPGLNPTMVAESKKSQ